jgi:colanic acid/amylovoran biosynthesis glycosyltransferase
VSGPRRGLHLLEVGLLWPPETFLCWKLERLAARGFRVTVASTTRRRDAEARLEGVELECIPYWGEARAVVALGVARDGLRLLLRSPRRFAALISAARRPLPPGGRKKGLWDVLPLLRSYLRLAALRPNVVHFEWNSAAVHYLPLYEIWNCPVVISCHGSDVNIRPHTPLGERLAAFMPASFEKASAVHCVSEAIAREATRFGLEPAKARLIRPAVDPAFFTPSVEGNGRESPDGDEHSEFRVLAIGDFRWLKGHEYAIQAIRHLADRGVPVRFDVLGGGEEDRIRHTIEDLALGERVNVHGDVPSAEVRRRLQRADALLHASLSEGTPTAVLEAMACRVPVVVTDCGGVREAVSDGVEGIVVGVRESKEMAAALEKLWRDPALRRRMGRAGRARVESEFTLAEQVDRFVELYEGVAAAPGGAGA